MTDVIHSKSNHRFYRARLVAVFTRVLFQKPSEIKFNFVDKNMFQKRTRGFR